MSSSLRRKRGVLQCKTAVARSATVSAAVQDMDGKFPTLYGGLALVRVRGRPLFLKEKLAPDWEHP